MDHLRIEANLVSEPILSYSGADAIRGATSELVSAMSALNMYPDPLPSDSTEPRYLSECDGWAKHAYAHMHAAFVALQNAERDREHQASRIRKLQLQLTKLSQGTTP